MLWEFGEERGPLKTCHWSKWFQGWALKEGWDFNMQRGGEGLQGTITSVQKAQKIIGIAFAITSFL